MAETIPNATAKPETLPGIPLQNIVHGVALALMLGWFLHIGASVLVPMVLGLMIAYVVVGLSRLMGAVPIIGKYIPLGGRYLLAFLIIGFASIEFVRLFAANIVHFVARAPEFQAQIVALAKSSAEFLGVGEGLNWETVHRDILGTVDLQALLRSGLSSTAALVAAFIFVMLNVVFMMLERRGLDAKLGHMSSDPVRTARLRALIADINNRIGRFMAAKTLINIGLGLVSYAIMAVAGLEFASLSAIVIALMNFIPYIGSFIGVSFPAVIAVMQFGQIEPVILLLVALAGAQFVIGSLIEPQVMGNSLDLSPYVILISLTAWTSLWGIAGAIVSIPITAVIAVILAEFSGTRPIAVLLSRTGELSARD